jgi:hypothetical protein
MKKTRRTVKRLRSRRRRSNKRPYRIGGTRF